MVGRKVIHKTYGVGVITDCRDRDGRVDIKVDFPDRKNVDFVYPDSFEKFLDVEDEDFREQIRKELESRDAKLQAEAEKKEQARLAAEQQREQARLDAERNGQRPQGANAEPAAPAVEPLTDEQIRGSYDEQNISEDLTVRG